jgi:hypothetical protein
MNPLIGTKCGGTLLQTQHLGGWGRRKDHESGLHTEILSKEGRKEQRKGGREGGRKPSHQAHSLSPLNSYFSSEIYHHITQYVLHINFDYCGCLLPVKYKFLESKDIFLFYAPVYICRIKTNILHRVGTQ